MARRPTCTVRVQEKNLARELRGQRCLYPEICPQIEVDHGKQLAFLKRLGESGSQESFCGLGRPHDLVLADRKNGLPYMSDVVRHHTSGQMKVAPEHTQGHVLHRMGKPGTGTILQFRDLFTRLTKAARREQFLTYYLIAAHPGCTERDMRDLKTFASRHLKINPRQVQIFTPTPSTYSSLMYYTEMDPFTGKRLFVEKDPSKKARQKSILVSQ